MATRHGGKRLAAGLVQDPDMRHPRQQMIVTLEMLEVVIAAAPAGRIGEIEAQRAAEQIETSCAARVQRRVRGGHRLVQELPSI
jgi:hypothetical protein